ncbi:hypothetical protein MesoLj113b_72590 (plasmid) [Mesorhizobium sp. 113-3-3]|nr:hypothetical protein MesoLj113b_72590 [Mesorhizobium sp. 113-3-3]
MADTDGTYARPSIGELGINVLRRSGRTSARSFVAVIEHAREGHLIAGAVIQIM